MSYGCSILILHGTDAPADLAVTSCLLRILGASVDGHNRTTKQSTKRSLGSLTLLATGEGATGLSYTSEFDEAGNPRNAADAGVRRYGWHGSDRRSADTPGGLDLVGARLYAPVGAQNPRTYGDLPLREDLCGSFVLVDQATEDRPSSYAALLVKVDDRGRWAWR
jgi:hypothetical protein